LFVFLFFDFSTTWHGIPLEGDRIVPGLSIVAAELSENIGGLRILSRREKVNRTIQMHGLPLGADPKLPLNRYRFNASRLVLGCMRFAGEWSRSDPLTAEHVRDMNEPVDAALSVGINMFDHADIYKFGKAEEAFGRILRERPGLRDSIVISVQMRHSFAGGPKRVQYQVAYSRKR